MVVRHALTTAGCSHCRLAALKLFASPTNALPIIRASSVSYRSQPVRVATIRTFSSGLAQNKPSGQKEPTEEESKEDEEALKAQSQDTIQDSSSNVPWYLQVEPPRHVASIEPQPLPEVPSGSPEIIGSLLEYVSEELGLDELSLLDLRELDPPAALGPNLFMLFGTARSERHLNVSAGRLVRWLRAKHRVYANADGLLGPNERKLKLRRKAKRAKLLGSTEENDDDGIKTGWVCVNLGTIGHGKEESAIVSEDGRVAGFGVTQDGCTVIVQIMTEFRRAEMGLEALWKQALGQPVDDSPKPETENPDNLHPLEKAILSNSHPPAMPRNGHFNDTSRRTPFEQTRSHSTQQAHFRDAPESNQLFDVDSKEALEQALKFDVRQKRGLLELLQTHLDTSSSFPAQQTSDPLNQYQDTLPFLRLSRLACQGLPPHQTWGFRLNILSKLRESGKTEPTEDFNETRRLVTEMNIYAIEITRQQCLQLLTCIYNSDIGELKEQTQLALALLKTMHQRGQPIIANDIVVTIMEEITRSSISNRQLQLLRQLDDLLLQANLPYMGEELVLRLMKVHLRRHDWNGFWDAWRIPPRYLQPRSAEMYTQVYQMAAATRSAAVCTMTLRRCFQEMLAEEPQVLPTGAVRTAVLDCIRIADRYAEENAEHGRRTKGEFVKLVGAVRYLGR